MTPSENLEITPPAPKPPKRKKIRNFSASQIQAFTDCERLWFLKWIMGIKDEEKPHQKRGKEIHDILETYLKTGKIPQDHHLGYFRYIEWLQHLLPDPNEERVASEHALFLDCPSGKPIGGYGEAEGIPLVGYVDVGMYDRDILEIGDLKTTTDLREAKTPAELHNDTQMNTYAKWAFEVEPELEVVRVTHYYVKVESGNDKDGNPKKAVKKPKSTKVLRVSTELTRAGVEAIWARDCATMEKMKIAALADSFEDLTPSVNFCPKYGGCSFRDDKCTDIKGSSLTLFPEQPLTKLKKGQSNMGFLDKINAAKKAQGKEVTETKTETKAAPKAEKEAPPKTGSFTSKFKSKSAGSKKETKAAEKADSVAPEETEAPVVPPDGADRQTSVEESEAIRAEAAEKLEKKTKKEKAPKRGKHKRAMTLYIGCMPSKGEHQDFMMIEDWEAPMIAEINETVRAASEGAIGHYILLPKYGEKDVVLADAITARIEAEGLPSALVISGYNHSTNFLIPHATDVVRAIGK